jgi:hypothetical protein
VAVWNPGNCILEFRDGNLAVTVWRGVDLAELFAALAEFVKNGVPVSSQAVTSQVA